MSHYVREVSNWAPWYGIRTGTERGDLDSGLPSVHKLPFYRPVRDEDPSHHPRTRFCLFHLEHRRYLTESLHEPNGANYGCVRWEGIRPRQQHRQKREHRARYPKLGEQGAQLTGTPLQAQHSAWAGSRPCCWWCFLRRRQGPRRMDDGRCAGWHPVRFYVPARVFRAVISDTSSVNNYLLIMPSRLQ